MGAYVRKWPTVPLNLGKAVSCMGLGEAKSLRFWNPLNRRRDPLAVMTSSR